MIHRTLAPVIQKNQKDGFINIIYGPRRVGKTTLLHELTHNIPSENIKMFNGDDAGDRQLLSQNSIRILGQLIRDFQFVIVDEAQRIPNIGLSLKILIDLYPEKTFYVSGSSSLLLSRGVHESLTGRNQTYKLFPLNIKEISSTFTQEHYIFSALPEVLTFGSYPHIWQLSAPQEKESYLKSIVHDYLFLDVLELADIASPENLKKIATLLAFQIGREVSFNEISRTTGFDVKTVQRYITLLKESFIIFEVPSFSRNVRQELNRAKKYYFWDPGIRNALIGQFGDLDTRPDRGGMWENFLAVERLKKIEYEQLFTRYFFWRTYEQAEIDWIEENNGQLFAYEFKWLPKKPHTPKAFKDAYHVDAKIISKENYMEFVT